MAHRINTRNFENGMDNRSGQSNWKKHISRHCQFWSKAEMMEAFGTDRAAAKAIEAYFSPQVIGEHLYLNLEDGQNQVCCGFIDPQSGGFFLIELASQFGEHCEIVFGKKNAIARLFEIFKNATA